MNDEPARLPFVQPLRQPKETGEENGENPQSARWAVFAQNTHISQLLYFTA